LEPRLYHQQKRSAGPGQNTEAKSHLSETQGPDSPATGWAGPIQNRERRKKERKKESVGERRSESERKLPDKQAAAPQLLITLRFRFLTL